MESVRYVYIIHCFGMLHMLYVIQQQLLQVQYIFLISVPFLKIYTYTNSQS